MPFVFLLAITGLTLSAVAIYYSVIGLTAIFAAAFWPIVIMGTTLEISKLVAASWLKWNWNRIPRAIKSYMLTSVFVLMFITSMGIFGFLSKAHIEQTSMSTEQVAQIGTLEEKIARSEAKINRWLGEVDRLMKGEDVRVDSLIANEQEGLDKIYARIKDEKATLQEAADKKIALQQERIAQAQDRRDKAIAAAEEKFKSSFGGSAKYDKAVEDAKKQELSVASIAQKEILSINTQLDADIKSVEGKYSNEIRSIQKRIQNLRNQANAKTQDIDGRIAELEGLVEKEQLVIDESREEKFAFEKTYRQLEAEVGPIKYIAEFIYGETDQSILERAVTWVIITIIFVFDPLAVLMLLAAQMTYAWAKGLKEEEQDDSDSENPQSTEERDPPPPPPAIEESIETEDEVVEIVDQDPEVIKVEEETPVPIKEEIVEEPKSKKKTEEIVEDDDEEDYFENAHPTEKAAMHRWKAENPNGSLKIQKKLYELEKIDDLPWWSFMEEEDAKNARDLAEDHFGRKKIFWMEHNENGQQVKKESYVQNQEQGNDSIWKEIQKGKE